MRMETEKAPKRNLAAWSDQVVTKLQATTGQLGQWASDQVIDEEDAHGKA